VSAGKSLSEAVSAAAASQLLHLWRELEYGKLLDELQSLGQVAPVLLARAASELTPDELRKMLTWLQARPYPNAQLDCASDLALLELERRRKA